MLDKMMLRKTTGTRKNTVRVLTGMLAAAALMAGAGRAMAQGSGKIGPAAPVTYDNKYEIYGGANFMNFQAGQDLPTRMNMGGAEVLGTYWLMPKLGLGAQWRGEWGTTPIHPNAFLKGRAGVSMNMVLFGAQYRGPKNHYAALNYHAYAGPAFGNFTRSTGSVPPQYLPTLGLYTNRTAALVALGGSVDFNRSKNLAVRISPDLILEHFGSETRMFFAISGGVIYRFGHR
ncbi:MAG TPA: hypothetical protein VIX42_02760 [Edaphobacter sp.]